MCFLPDEAIKPKEGLTLAPIVDFLFLVLMLCACVAVIKVRQQSTEVTLVKSDKENARSFEQIHIIPISINATGGYSLNHSNKEIHLKNPSELKETLLENFRPLEKETFRVNLYIDQQATWEPILKAILVIKDLGFEVYPVYANN